MKMEAIYKRIEDQFKSRAEANKWGKKSAKYKKEQAAFFIGAMAALVAITEQETFDKPTNMGQAMPPKWVISIMRGDDILSEKY